MEALADHVARSARRRWTLSEEQYNALLGRSSTNGDDAPTRVIARSDSTSTGSSGTQSCAPNDDSGLCQKPVGSDSMTLPIVLGILIPLGLALCVLIYLHRRTLRRLKREDATDPHKSLDFGLGDGGRMAKGARKSQRGEKDQNRYRQLSMDMNLTSPYLLPPGLQSSRESLHSLSRTLHQAEDPYRPVAQYAGSDTASIRSARRGQEDALLYTTRSGERDPSRRRPVPAVEPLGPQRNTPSPPSPLAPAHTKPEPPPLNTADLDPPHTVDLAHKPSDPFLTPSDPTPSRRESLPYPLDHEMPGQAISDIPTIQEPEPVAQPPTRNGLPGNPRQGKVTRPEPPAVPEDEHWDQAPQANPYAMPEDPAAGLGIGSSHQPQQDDNDKYGVSESFYHAGHDEGAVDPSMAGPAIDEHQEYYDYSYEEGHQQDYYDESAYDERGRPLEREGLGYHQQDAPQNTLALPPLDSKRHSVGFRPLPPDEIMESDDPEMRANRIRSFYKEYFDESRGPPPPMPHYQGGPQYHEDYDAGYYEGDATYFDPQSNAFVTPYAQPVSRRAMTPPPSGSRFPGPRPPRGHHGSMGGMSARGGYPVRPGSSASNGPGPRAGSAMSGRSGRPGGPKKPIPPPAALTTLPTPSKLRDDSFAIFNAIDFAPPESFADRARGRSQSPSGERRPYQPKLPAHSPLVNAFDELAALPSPHLLRKSGTFTGLDFAPPRKFGDASDSRSETGSIRSNRSGISQVQLNAIRSGAGRVSRLPGDTIFTQAQLSQKLKPQWGMRP